jgi:signal transduction histidine kinase
MALNKDSEEQAVAVVSEAAIEQILSLISHELRTPMTALRGRVISFS